MSQPHDLAALVQSAPKPTASQLARLRALLPAPAEPADAELLDYAGVSALTGLAASTLRQYKATGRMPKPDEMPAPDRPRWRAGTIRAWSVARPGRGAPGRPRARRATS